MGEVAYKLELPEGFSGVHDVFHVSQLRKCLGDHDQVVGQQEVQLQPDLTYEEQPVMIVDQRDKALRNQIIPLVRVEWTRGDSTWERRDQMVEKYP